MGTWYMYFILKVLPWEICNMKWGFAKKSHNKVTKTVYVWFEFLWIRRYVKMERIFLITPGETENEWQKTEPVPILLLRGARSFFDAKKMKKKKILAWTSEIIQFIRYPIQMDRTERTNFFGGKCWLFIVIQFCYNGLWPFSH
jgi:hypothetical protein